MMPDWLDRLHCDSLRAGSQVDVGFKWRQSQTRQPLRFLSKHTVT